MTNDADGPQSVALGTAHADLVVANGRVVLPEPRTIVDRDIAVRGGLVAAVTDDAGDVTGPETTIVDAEGQIITPGFVNAHVHIDSFQPFERAYHRVLETGTTSVVTETCEFGSCFGESGVRQLLEATDELPVQVFATVPPQAFLDAFSVGYEQFDDADREELSALLSEDRIVGIGEIPWVQIVGRSSPVEQLAARARTLGKTVSGHGAGCAGRRLTAFATAITDDHEMVSSEGVAERLENGIHAVGRYGTFRDDIDALADAYEQFGPAELSLSTDWIWPTDIVAEGYMDAVVRRAIEAGIAPVDAVRMATLNPARHFGLPEVGSLSPGSRADIVVLDDLETVAVETVISGGEIVVDGGTAVVEPRPRTYPDWFRDSISLTVDESALRVPTTAGSDGEVRAIQCEGGTVTSETTVEPATSDGQFIATPDRDALKVALFDRTPDGTGAGFTGFLSGFGLEAGAVATSHTWQTPGVLAVGADEDAMRRAIADVVEVGGGWVVRDAETSRVTFPTPIGARCADCDIAESAERVAAVTETLRELGARLDEPALILQALPFTGVPSLRMSFSGYEDVFERKTVGLDPAT
ncbi:adenine deaminase C-terminal domain-containing protein [Natrinema sp. 1APR25-10V2]|uniref:adenine deaminase C-terminal domain-containing protein n=1 Tax=Natrinema sp. 1APR25-10V2 TaxID=2951081 RepID=UPI0028758E2C|nr:adenine deaminase C-terminal domain-containing protein [Natrinema sp. 1APR25-10V2]MDS0477021.1 amidohydrolase family protein [Natrinema sp. 1APR25-10V2]